MTLQDLSAVAAIILGSIGGGSVIAAAVARRIIEPAIGRALERERDRFARGQFIHKLQFEKEFTLYEAIWKTLVDVRSATLALRPLEDFQPGDKSPEEIKRERLRGLADAYDEFATTMQQNEPFFPSEVYLQMLRFVVIVNQEGLDYHGEGLDYERKDPQNDEGYWQAAVQNAEEIRRQTRAICESIRTRIGNVTVLLD